MLISKKSFSQKNNNLESHICKNVFVYVQCDVCINVVLRYTDYAESFIIPHETEGYRFGLPSVRRSVCPSVCLSHPEGGCFVDITSPLIDVPKGFFSPYSIQTRIIDVQRQGFS